MRGAALMLLTAACGRLGYDAASGDGPRPDGAADGATPVLLDATADGAAAACPPLDGDTLALLPLDDDLADVLGAHPGTYLGGGSATFVAGPPGCGRAIRLTGGEHVRIEDSDAWDAPEGSFDFWIRFDSDGTFALLSREAANRNEPNHLAFYRMPGGDLVVRLQNPSFDPDRFLCSDAPVPPGAWTHVGVNFGPPRNELWVGGVRATRSGQGSFYPIGGFDQAGDCNTDAAVPLAGNSNPILLGAGSTFAPDGAGTPTDSPVAGALDHVRISRVRRDFGR